MYQCETRHQITSQNLHFMFRRLTGKMKLNLRGRQNLEVRLPTRKWSRSSSILAHARLKRENHFQLWSLRRRNFDFRVRSTESWVFQGGTITYVFGQFGNFTIRPDSPTRSQLAVYGENNLQKKSLLGNRSDKQNAVTIEGG